MAVVFVSLLFAVLLATGILTLLSLPGNWLMVAATATYVYFVPAESSAAIGWRVVMALIVLAALGSTVELLAVAMGVAKAGGSRRAP